jgi:hypothetical protein
MIAWVGGLLMGQDCQKLLEGVEAAATVLMEG